MTARPGIPAWAALPKVELHLRLEGAAPPEFIRRLAVEGIVLEVNPGSYPALGLYPDWASHPVARLRGAGVAVALSTDDPPYFQSSLAAEYDALSRAFGWTPADFAAINGAAAAAAFCNEATRASVLSRLEPA